MGMIKSLLKWFGIFVVLLVIAALIFGDKKPKQEAQASSTTTRESASVESSPGQPPVTVTATQLARAYHENEVSADDQFKGKQLLVSGTVTEIAKDVMDDVYVSLNVADDLLGVQAHGLKPAFAAKLKKGQQVTVRCEGAGMIVTIPQLKECVPQG